MNMICSVKPMENSSELLVRVLFANSDKAECPLILALSLADDNTFTDGRQNESSTHMSDITR